MKIKTWLPLFPGFYESLYSYQFDDIEHMLFDNCRAVPKQLMGWISSRISDYVDYSAYENQVAKNFTDCIESEIKERFPELVKSIKFEKIVSPKYYNFSTDSIDIEVDIDFEKLISLFLADKQSAEYIKKRYASYDGFMSHYENNLDDWLKTVKEDKAHKTGAMLEFLLKGLEPIDLYYAVMDSICNIEYIDYNKLIEDINSEYDISIKDLTELENIEDKYPGGIATADEIKFLSMLYGIEVKSDGLIAKASLIPSKYPELMN